MGSAAPAMEAHAARWNSYDRATTNSGIAPGDPNQGGYHNSRKKLTALGKTNDYSLRLPWDQKGNSDRYRAHDRGINDSARMTMYMKRVRDGYNVKDPRFTGWREFLGAIDGNLIGFNTTPYDWYTRTPDSSHYTHIHESIFGEFVDEVWPYTNIESLYRGETLAYWRRNDSMAEFTDELARQISNADTYLWLGFTQLNDTVTGIKSGTGTGTVDNKFARLFKAMVADVATIKAQVGQVLTTDQLEILADRISEELASRDNNPLTVDDIPVIREGVLAALRTGTDSE